MSTHRSTPAVTALLVVLVCLGLGSVVVGVLVVVEARTSSATVAITESPSKRPIPDLTGLGETATTSSAREVLRAWDLRREAAWIAGDEAALAELYVAGSVAGRRDVQLLRSWSARGARVLRLEPQVLELQVLRQRPHLLVVRVTDRLGILDTEVAGEPVTMPRDEATTRRLELRRGPGTTGRWRVARVRGAGVSR